MKTPNTTKRLGIWASLVAAVLMIPLASQAPWSVGDFIFAGVVLFGSAALYEFVATKIQNKTHRLAAGIAVAMMVVLIWAWAVAGP